jgi:protein SCO1/2
MPQNRAFTLVSALLLVVVAAGAVFFLLNRESDSSQVGDQPSGLAADLKSSYLDMPLEDFTLPSTTGEFSLSDQRGKVVLIYFGYMTCPDYCPATLADLQRVMRDLGEDRQRVQVVFMTVDPERDSLERLTLFLAAFDESFIGVRGEQQATFDVLNQFGVTMVKREVDSAVGYLVDHTASVFMIGTDGRLISRFPHETPYEDIVHDVRVLLNAPS